MLDVVEGLRLAGPPGSCGRGAWLGPWVGKGVRAFFRTKSATHRGQEALHGVIRPKPPPSIVVDNHETPALTLHSTFLRCVHSPPWPPPPPTRAAPSTSPPASPWLACNVRAAAAEQRLPCGTFAEARGAWGHLGAAVGAWWDARRRSRGASWVMLAVEIEGSPSSPRRSRHAAAPPPRSVVSSVHEAPLVEPNAVGRSHGAPCAPGRRGVRCHASPRRRPPPI